MVSSLQLVPAGNIIFSKRAPIGQVVINAIDLCTNQGCLAVVLMMIQMYDFIDM